MQTPTLPTSSYASGGLAAYQTMIRCGVDPEAVLQQVGLDVEGFSTPGARIDTETFCTFLQLAFERCEEPAFGLLAADYVHPTSYHAWGLALLASSTIRSYMQRWVRYYPLIATHASITMVDRADSTGLRYHFTGPEGRFPGAARIMRDANLAVILRYVRLRLDPGYQPAAVDLMHESAEGRDDLYQQYLGGNIAFGSDRNIVWFAADELDRTLPGANPELARQNDGVLTQFRARMQESSAMLQAQARIVELLPSGTCSKTAVAKAMFMSARTLHNRLAAEGTSYQRLFDETREALARQYILQPDLAVSEVGELLGFTDHSSFTRSFQRWMGCSPSAYRSAHRVKRIGP